MNKASEDLIQPVDTSKVDQGILNDIAEALLPELDKMLGGNGDGTMVGKAAALRGVLDDRPVLPFKKQLTDLDAFADAILGWLPNYHCLPTTDSICTIFSAFYAGMLHQQGYRPGDDPTQPPPQR